MAEIKNIGLLLPNKLDNNQTSVKPQVKTSEVSFADMLKDTLKDVNSAQLQADEAVQKVLNGETKDIQSTMVALQKADVSLKMMLEVRNKILQAYQEVLRTQV